MRDIIGSYYSGANDSGTMPTQKCVECGYSWDIDPKGIPELPESYKVRCPNCSTVQMLSQKPTLLGL